MALFAAAKTQPAALPGAELAAHPRRRRVESRASCYETEEDAAEEGSSEEGAGKAVR